MLDNLNDKETVDSTGYTKDEISNMKRSAFKKFLKTLADAIKRFVEWLIDKSLLVLDKIKNMDQAFMGIANMIKGAAQFLNSMSKFQKKSA